MSTPPPPPTRNLSDEQLTQAVLAELRARALAALSRGRTRASCATCTPSSPRSSRASRSGPTAIDFLTRTGQISDERRQEFILLSDVLGVSMLVIGINHRVPDGATESTVFGPFFVAGRPRSRTARTSPPGAPGVPCLMSGRIRDVDGAPIPGAVIDVWQADEAGFYDVQ